MHTNYGAISRKDDEPYDAEGEWVAERADELYQQYLGDKDKIEDADSWNDGMQEGEHYSELERVMATLHSVQPSDLLGSGVLVDLYRLAMVHGKARDNELRRMAEAQAQIEWGDRQTGPDDH